MPICRPLYVRPKCFDQIRIEERQVSYHLETNSLTDGAAMEVKPSPTIENTIYGVDWKKCAVCGLIAPDVGDIQCKDVTRCSRVIRGEALSVIEPEVDRYTHTEVTGPAPNHYDLTDEDKLQLVASIKFRELQLDVDAEDMMEGLPCMDPPPPADAAKLGLRHLPSADCDHCDGWGQIQCRDEEQRWCIAPCECTMVPHPRDPGDVTR